jgi:hypothetical protein
MTVAICAILRMGDLIHTPNGLFDYYTVQKRHINQITQIPESPTD